MVQVLPGPLLTLPSLLREVLVLSNLVLILQSTPFTNRGHHKRLIPSVFQSPLVVLTVHRRH